MPLSDELIFSVLLSNSQVKRSSDAAILLQGDGYSRVAETAFLYKEVFANKVVISGAVREEERAGVSSLKLKEALEERNVPGSSIILEDKSLNTRDQGVEVVKLVVLHSWKQIILVTSHFHQFRAFLTFLRAMQKAGIQIKMYNSPARCPNWFTDLTEWGPTRADLLEAEFEKISKYKDDVATFKEGIDYLRWLEANI